MKVVSFKEKSIRDTIYSEILEDIASGKIYPGEKLVESELAKKFNVSRSPVREALLQLEKEGFIVHRKNVGAVVRKISSKELSDTYELVALLEGFAIENATDNFKEKDIAFLKRLQESMEDSVKCRKFSAYVELNSEFHRFFVEKARNEKLWKVISSLRKSIYRVVLEGQTLPSHIDKYLASHRKIIKLVARRDIVGAANLMRSHVLDARKFLIEIIRDRGKKDF